MAKRRNGISWLLGIIGFLLQPFWVDNGGYSYLGLIGTILLIAALSLYATAKGRHWTWGLFGLLGVLSFIGILVIWCLADYSKVTPEEK